MEIVAGAVFSSFSSQSWSVFLVAVFKCQLNWVEIGSDLLVFDANIDALEKAVVLDGSVPYRAIVAEFT